MNNQLEKILLYLAWLVVFGFIAVGLIGNFAPSLAYEYPSITEVITDNLWWLMIISLIVIVRHKKLKKNDINKKKNIEYTPVQAILMVIAVGFGLFLISLITNTFGIMGIIGGMIGVAFSLFSSIKKKSNEI